MPTRDLGRRATFAALAFAAAVGGFFGLRAWLDAAPSGPIDPAERSTSSAALPPPALAGAKRRAPSPIDPNRLGSIVGLVFRGAAPSAARVEAWLVSPAAALGDLRPASPSVGGAHPFPSEAGGEPSVVAAGPDGRFALERLEPGLYHLLAVQGDARAAACAEISRWGGIVETTLRLRPSMHELRGRAAHADGSPWRGKVFAVAGTEDGRSWRSGWMPGDPTPVETSGDGSFVLRGLASGFHRVSGFDDGGVVVAGPRVAIRSSETYALVVDVGVTWTVGRVTADDGATPIAGATVTSWTEARGESDAGTGSLSSTGTDGAFRSLLGGKDATLDVEAAGFESASERYYERPVGPIVVRLSRSGRIRGRVTTEADGKPVARIVVTANASRSAVTGEDGRYEIADAPLGDVLVTAQGDGWVARIPSQAREDAMRVGAEPTVTTGVDAIRAHVDPGGATTVDLVLVRGVRATGKVVDRQGSPIPLATVSAWPSDGSRGDVDLLSTRCRPDGTYAVDGLRPERAWDVRASAPGFLEETSTRVRARSDAPTTVEFTLSRSRWVDVRVVDGGGAPVDGAEVSFVRNEWFWGQPECATGADGVARLGPLGLYSGTVRARANGFAGAEEPLPETAREGESATLTLRLERARRIAGRVTWADGTPAAGLEVRREDWGSARTEIDGRFAFDDVEPGEHTLRCLRHWSAVDETCGVQTIARAGAEDVLLTLPCAAPEVRPAAPVDAVLFRVVDGDGRAVPYATIRYAPSTDSGSTDARNGVASIPRSSTVHVLASGARSSSGATLPLGPVGWRGPAAEGVREVELRMPPGRAIFGFVRDSEGRGISGVDVHASGSIESAVEMGAVRLGSAVTDAEGGFRIDGLSDADCLVAAEEPAGFLPTAAASVPPGGGPVVLTLLRGASAVVTVIDTSGRPVAHATVRAVPPPDDPSSPRLSMATVTTDDRGLAVLDRLSRDVTYGLTADGPSGSDEEAWAPAERRDWRPADVVLTLRRLPMTRGVVRDTRGRPVFTASVEVWEERGDQAWWRSACSSDEGGRFALGLDGEREVRIRASFGRLWGSFLTSGFGHADDNEVSVRRSAERVVRLGANDADLVIDLGLPLDVVLDGWPSTSPTLDALLAEDESSPGGQGSASGAEEPAVAHRTSGGSLVLDDLAGGFHSHVDAKGETHFVYLDPASTYTLWVGSLADGRIAYVHGLRGSETPQHVGLTQGLPIHGRLVLAQGATDPSVTARVGPILVPGTVGADGRFAFAGLPRGPVRLDAKAYTGSGATFSRFLGTATVAAGGTVDIVLAPEPPKK